MYKHVDVKKVLVRVIITAIISIAMVVTSATNVHAQSTQEINSQIISTNQEQEQSKIVDNLSDKSQKEDVVDKLFEDDAPVAEKLRILDNKIVFLIQEIAALEMEIATSADQEQVQKEYKAKQAALEKKCEDNKDKLESIGTTLTDMCTNNSLSISSITSQISLFKRVASNNADKVEKIVQTEIESIRVQSEIIGREDKLAELKADLFNTQNLMLMILGYDQMQFETWEPIYLEVAVHNNENGISWVDPCVYKKISSPFGMRIHPVYGDWRMHNGVDLPNKHKTPIYATRSGVVIDSGWDDSSGWHVTIDHMDGYKSTYLHMNSQSKLKIGDFVFVGDYIGPMGTTGTSTGTHLHFGISINDEWVDPMLFINEK